VASVLGLLEAREKRVREEIVWLREEAERVQAALGEAEAALQRLVDGRATVAEVMAGPPSVVTEPAGSAVAGSTVPRRVEGMAASVLAPDYRRIVSVLESEAGREGMRCRRRPRGCGRRRNAWWSGGGRSRCGRGCSPLSRWRPSKAGRAASDQPTAHEHGHRPQHHGFVHGGQCFVVAHQAPRAHQPARWVGRAARCLP
jgi:hypothetical protein